MRKTPLPFLLTAAFFCCCAAIGSAQSPEPAEESPSAPPAQVKSVEISGNKVISTSTIIAKVKTRVGQPYYPQVAREDIKRLYETGFFSDITLDVKEEPEGLVVTFRVEERPVIQEIRFEGNAALSRAALVRLMKSKAGQYLNYSVLKEDIEAIKKEYEKKGVPDVGVEYRVDPAEEEESKSVVIVAINEGKRIKIRKVYVDNNFVFTDDQIMKLIKTRPAWLMNAGAFKEDQLDDDLERIKAFYLKNGYLDIKVDYRLDYDEAGDLHVRIAVEEGKQYKVGSIALEGNETFSDEEVLGSLKVCLAGDTFTYDALREDVANIQGFYFGRGYIFCQIKESTSLDAQTGRVDIAYSLVENEVAYVDRIMVRGNLKTKDKVIRREMRIRPGERFDGDKLKRSKERLYNLGFFEEVNYDTEPGTEPDQRNLVVDVKEAKTGSFSFGGGYSSVDQLVGFVEIEQRNFDWRNWKTFTGAGQDLKVRAELGSVRQTYELSFTEPWWLDRPVSAGFDLYNRYHEEDDDLGYGYNERRVGGDLRLGKEFTEYIKGGTTYRLENVDISDVDDDASQDLKSEEGENLISSQEFYLTRDTTDNVFNPRSGLVLSGSFEIAGGLLGGDKDYTKLFTLVTKYIPLFGKGVLQLQLRGGVAWPFSDQPSVPIYERFYAGGANTIRGYEERSVGPLDPVTDDPLGGESLLIGNNEYTNPIIEFMKAAVFLDTGNVWTEASDFASGGYKSGVGFGVRVKTPVGPLKLDYGIPLDEVSGRDKEGRFHFSMSHGF